MEEKVIDLGAAKWLTKINEGFLEAFGYFAEMGLKRLFGYDLGVPLKVKGTPSEIRSFTNALNNEKKYMEAYKKHGLTDSRTLNNKSLLDKAVAKFQSATGLKWPFK